MAPTGAVVTAQYGTGEKGSGVNAEKVRVLRQPRGLHLCEDGSLLVADFGNHCVIRFGPKAGDRRGKVVAGEEGKMLQDVDPSKDMDKPGPMGPAEGEGQWLKRPVSACEDGQGGVYVLDSDMGRIQRFGGAGGGPAQTVAPPGAAHQPKARFHAESVKNPRGLLLCPDGAAVVCDSWSHRVLRYEMPPPGGDPAAEAQPAVLLAGSPNTCGSRPDQLAFPSGAAVAPDGTLLVADTNNHRVQRFKPGEPLATTAAGSPEGKCGGGPGELNMPTGICVDPQDGSFLVTDRANARVLRFAADSRAGDPGEVVAGPDLVERPWGVCLGPDGAVYVSDERRALVLRLEVCGSPGGKEGPSPPAQPAAAAPPPEADVPAGPVGGGANTLD